MPVAKRWADFDLDFAAHPNTGELSMKYDADAIIKSVRNLILTNHYERAFHPELGSNLMKQLFEPMTFATALRIKGAIAETLNNFEPRVTVNELQVEAREEENGYMIFLRFFIINEETERVSTFFLERNR